MKILMQKTKAGAVEVCTSITLLSYILTSSTFRLVIPRGVIRSVSVCVLAFTNTLMVIVPRVSTVGIVSGGSIL